MSIAPCVIIWNQALLQGEFENMATCAYLEEYLLECRRYEKNYFLRGGAEYSQLQGDYFEQLTAATRRLRKNPAIGDRVAVLLGKEVVYKERFNSLVSEIESGTRDRALEDNSFLEMIAVARECETLIREIREVTADRFNSTVTRSQFVNFLSVIVGILLAIIVSGLIADRVVFRSR
jgi:hypothetical protein